jgi:RND family efflux transporter MFP subunit
MNKKLPNSFLQLVGSVVVVCSCLVLFSIEAKELNAAPKARPVVVATVEMREMAPVNWYPGTVISRAQTEVSAEVEGKLTFSVEVGAQLAKGDVIAKLDPEILEQEKFAAAAETRRVKAKLVFLQKEVKRLQRLAKQNNAAQSQLEQSASDLAAAKSELAAANAQENLANKRLQRCVINAPFAGVITRRMLEAGEWASSGAVVAVMIDTGRLEVQSWVPVSVLPFVTTGANLDLDVYKQISQASVRVVVPATESQSRLYELRLTPERQDLHVGQSVRIAVPTALPQQVLAVSRDALVLRRNSISVFRINSEDLAENLLVTTGIASEDMIEVKGNLQPGDRVVIRGGERLRDGLSVIVQPLEILP